jgi:hypothetical protein
MQVTIAPHQYQPTDKLEHRARRNFLSAVAMLGHLCALYDRGLFEAGRLMSNLIFQLVVKRKSTNTPLIEQVGLWDSFRVVVDVETLGSRVTSTATTSPLVGLIFGLRKNDRGALVPAAYWLPAMCKRVSVTAFAQLTPDEWLDDPVIPTTHKTLSRRELIVAVRDQDGGAHSDPDPKLQRSIAYVELVNSFPISKFSAVQTPGKTTPAWELLPPVTLPILRQISHELISAVYSQTDIRECLYLPALVCIFRGTELQRAFVPEEYPDMGPVYGKAPGVIPRPK